jgi:hypothetical protein
MNIINIDTKEGYTIFINEIVRLLGIIHSERLLSDSKYKARQEALELEYDRIFNSNNDD